MRNILYLIISVLLALPGVARPPVDTLHYSINDVEKTFLENNLLLVAEKLNISQADAKILQAKAWPNPSFTLNELQLYRSASTEDIPPVVGNVWRNRNFAMQLEQLVQTAGKRKKNINLEVRNKEMAEVLLSDLLQALKAELRQTVVDIQYLQSVQESWAVQQQEVARLMQAQQSQWKNGYISQADFLRLKALHFSLKGELTALATEMNARQKTLKTLLYINPETYVVISDSISAATITQLKQHTLPYIIGLSKNSTRLLIAEKQVRINEAQLAIEKAARVPDLNLMASYDRAGSTMLNFVGVGVAVDLPFFNRNKGNIKAAQHELQKNELLFKNTTSEVNNTVVQHWTDLQLAINLYETLDAGYIASVDALTHSVSKNFSEHNINLLQFLDFYESFRDTKAQYYNAIRNILLKKEDLSYLLGTELNEQL